MARKNLNRNVKKTRSSRRRSEEMPALETENYEGTRGSRSKGFSRQSFANRDYKDILVELAGNPTVRYVAGGIATALLTRLANNWSDKYPEISKFIRDNVDTLEGKFGSLKDDLGSTQRH